MVDGKNVIPEVHAALDKVKTHDNDIDTGCLNHLVQDDYTSAVTLILLRGELYLYLLPFLSRYVASPQGFDLENSEDAQENPLRMLFQWELGGTSLP